MATDREITQEQAKELFDACRGIMAYEESLIGTHTDETFEQCSDGGKYGCVYHHARKAVMAVIGATTNG
ncbi:hypothetical protein LCGC14_1306040 [marine sediment metagenome]|uniref:Uncharacterized protein n=1 Tax=marine sediment metagenome TaxID=412755 RepID=A0A0F9KNR7_9ZZZZ